MSGANSFDIDNMLDREPQAEDIANLWTQYKTARVGVEDRWKETTAYKYATSTRETANSDVGGMLENENGWSHSTHIPKLTQIADNLSANYMASMLPHEAFFIFSGESADAVLKTKRTVIASYIRSKHRLNGFRTIMQKLVDDWIEFGNCFAEVGYTREVNAEESLGEFFTNYVGPTLTRISPYDIVFNPLATDFEHSPKIIRRLKTLGELARDIDENPEAGWSEDALKKSMEFRSMVQQSMSEEDVKNTQLTFDGFGNSSQYFTSGYVEVLEFYGDIYNKSDGTFLKNHVITVIDRAFVLRSEPLNTWNGRPHIYHCGWRTRPDNLWAMGPLDNLVGMQYYINHIENAKADAFDQMVAPTRVLVGNVENVGAEAGIPGGEYRIPDGEGSVTNLAPDTTVLNADLMISRKEQQMEDFAGAPRNELGIRTQGEQTKFEVQALGRASSRFFQNKINYFEENFLEKILNAELEVSIRNLDGSDVAKVLDPETGAETFLTVTADDLNTNGKIVPQGARHFARMNQLASNLSALEAAMTSDQLMAQHISSVAKAEMYAEFLQLEGAGLLQPYVRVGEQAELQALTNAATTQVESQDMVNVGGGTEEEDEEVIQ